MLGEGLATSAYRCDLVRCGQLHQGMERLTFALFIDSPPLTNGLDHSECFLVVYASRMFCLLGTQSKDTRIISI